jgi:uncharacterized SAM-binding protein YcdF (DUF218 family)
VIRWTFRILAALLAVYGLGFAAFALTMPKPAGEERTDAIVVLTGLPGGRLERGFELMQRHLARRMLISGVERTVKPRELIAHYHVAPDLFECCIVLGRESYDTRSNAEEVAHWVARRHIRSIRLVTNDFHMPRARYELGRRLGADIVIVADAVPTVTDLSRSFGEYNKLLFAWAAGLVGI